MALVQNGQPFVGYVSLTNGAPGPVVFVIYTNMGQPAYTLGAAVPGTYPNAERLYITNIALSSNDTAKALITIDSGGTTPTKLASQYQSAAQPPSTATFPPGSMRCIPGIVPRATASAVSVGKAVNVTIKGFISRS